ncbi:MAG: ferrochelatase [Vicinamibacterales bacterium]
MSEACRAAPIGVLLFNLGGPDSLADVEPFLVRLFSDRDIIELPLGGLVQPLFARAIAKARGPSVRRNYASIGGKSPQKEFTTAQAVALQARLDDAGIRRCVVGIAMRYWRPDTATALAEMARSGVSRLVTLTLYPQYSRATTGSSRRELDRVLARAEWQGRFQVSHIESYPDHPLYLEAMTDTVRSGLERFPPESRGEVVLLFSAHGLPKKFADAGDPYVEHVERTIDGILARLRIPNRHEIGFQSRTGPVEWIGPDTAEVLQRLGGEGVKRVLVVPVSFVSDHIETLYEVDQLFREDARQAGITDYRRTDALNTHPLFIAALADLVEHHLASS